MQRYLVERTFAIDGDSVLPGPDDSLQKHLDFAENNACEGVIWIHSYISPDKQRSFCIYDAPTPEAIRCASMRNGLPIDRISEVCLLTTRLQLPNDMEFARGLQIRSENPG